jgi:hypothetical protein
MSLSRTPIFHIGANKAGSTTLQQALFARHPEILNLGKPSDRKNPGDAGRAIAALRDACELGVAPAIAEQRALWTRATEPAAGRLVVFSHEELIRRRYYPEQDPARMVRAIVEMAGPVRVVMVARHQIDLLESLYIHKANTATYLPPDRWLADNPDWINTYRFDEVADAWASVIGERNVGVFLFEEMVRDTPSFAARLANFMGIDAAQTQTLLSAQHKNPRKSGRTQAYVKLRSAFFPRASLGALLPPPVRRAWHKYLDGGAPSRERLPDGWREAITEGFRSGNRKLADRFRLPLEQYNYPI